MTTAITRYAARDQPEVVRHAAWLLCRWLTEHPDGAALAGIQADPYFRERVDHATGEEVTADVIETAARVLVEERRVVTEGDVYRLQPALRTPLDVTTLEWKGAVVPGFKRKRYTMRLSLCPSGWPLPPERAGYPGHEICGSVFDRVRDPSGFCDALPIWRITRSNGRMTGTQYWCDEELPVDLRAAAVTLEHQPGTATRSV
ncbi:hypothetical protein ACWEN4_27245 [Streptomyces violaceorubidus]|nr:hypothetical protein [Streptomyces diastatochromogenes]